MKASVLIVLTAIVLLVVSILATMNNACKSSRHGWCAPMSALRQDIKLEPTEQYSHPFNGPVVERVMPVAEVRSLCTSQGASPRGVACSWVSDGTCYLVLPNDGQAPVSTYRRHETAHCNGWPANHPHG